MFRRRHRTLAILGLVFLISRPGNAGKCFTIENEPDITVGACAGVNLNGKGVCVSSVLSAQEQQAAFEAKKSEWTSFIGDLTDAKCVDLFQESYCSLAVILGITETKQTGCDGANGCPLIMKWGIESGCERDEQCADFGEPIANQSVPNPCCEGLAQAFMDLCDGATLELVSEVYGALKLTLTPEAPRADRYFCRAQPDCVNPGPEPVWPCKNCQTTFDEAISDAVDALDTSDTLTDDQCSVVTTALEAYAKCMANADVVDEGTVCCDKYATVITKDNAVTDLLLPADIATVCPDLSSYQSPKCSTTDTPSSARLLHPWSPLRWLPSVAIVAALCLLQ